MKRKEFIKWLDEESDFSRNSLNDNDWKYMVDYVDFIYDYLEVEDNYVIFTWEELYWGGSNINNDKYTFEEFIEKYKNNSLKI